MTSCWTISLRKLTIQPKQARVAGTCADHNFFIWILFAYLAITEKKMQWTKKKDENLITRHRVRSQGDITIDTRFSGELSSTCHSVGFLCHRDVTSAVCHLVVLLFTMSRAHRMNPCSKRTRTYHLLHLLPESLVQQSVSKGIDGRVKYHYRVRDRSCKRTQFYGVSIFVYQVQYSVCSPRDYKNGTDGNNHQGDPLP